MTSKAENKDSGLVDEIMELWFIDFRDASGAVPKSKDCDEDIRELISLVRQHSGWVNVENAARLAVLAIKHCPIEHHDWEEVKKLSAGLITSPPTDSEGSDENS